MDQNKRSSISKGNSDEKIGEFWDTHDFTDFDTEGPDVKFEVTSVVPIDIELLNEIEKQAHKRGVKIETLINLWLQQKLAEQEQRAA